MLMDAPEGLDCMTRAMPAGAILRAPPAFVRRFGVLPPRLAVRLAWASALSILVAYTAAASIGRTTHGFIAYYGAARLFLAGELSADAYDDRWFNQYVQRLTSTGVREIFTPNPPTMALMAVPVAGLPPQGARTVWLFASMLVYAGAIWLLLRQAPPRRADLLPLVVFLLLVNPPVLANLRLGQAYLFVAAGYALFAVALLHDRQALAGATLGALLAMKATGAPLFLLLAATRRWRALAAGIAAVGAVAALTAPRVDRAMWTEYPGAVAGMIGRPTIGVTASQSTLSLARRLCAPDPDWNPRAPADCPGVAAILPGALIVLAVGSTALIARVPPTPEWLAAAIVLAVLAGPMAEDYHFAVLAVPIVLLLSTGAHVWPWIGLVALLLLTPLRLTAFRFQDGWSALVAYPRLYAAWLLWAVCFFGVRKWFRSLPGPFSL
jgi:hypothetical protein